MSKPSTYQEKLRCHGCDGRMDGGKWKIEQNSFRPETAKTYNKVEGNPFQTSGFLGSEYFAQRFNRPADENGQKKVLTDFLSPSVNFPAKFLGY